MTDGEAFIARSAGKVLLECGNRGRKTFMLWEDKVGGTLETTFDCEGAVLTQQLLKNTTSEQCIGLTLGAASSSVLEKAYEEVKLNKPCPSCGAVRLVRSADSISSSRSLPVMPIYCCTACNKQSYHITEEYLEFTVSQYLQHLESVLGSAHGISPEEHEAIEKDRQEFVQKLQEDRQSFIHELKENIIRIYAMKHIERIR